MSYWSETVENHAIYMTEDDDHEIYPQELNTFNTEHRMGIETIKRKRWGQQQKLHGKVSKFRDRYRTKYQYNPYHLPNYLSKADFQDDLAETMDRPLIDLEGEEIHSVQVSIFDEIAGIFTNQFSIWTDQLPDNYDMIERHPDGSVSMHTSYYPEQFLALERIAKELNEMNPHQRLTWAVDNEELLSKYFTIKFK